ncbi:hypothetical protein SAMN04487977_10417 [Treponema bryantii]|uniref:Uncharacterized protein n=1 Tax=Treponema bryantii TaxID=163 RepID=A0A1H9FF46_9SPIR|nr:hypothetical protein [Treponema bryantii]SEQ36571.1 hypothetical protein SAMN04487977_10417 [Treponema bryantii]
MQLLTIENGELRLNSNLDEYTFGKTGHDNILSYEGVIFDGKNFRQWTFEDVKSYDAEKNGSLQRLVFYCAKNPLGSDAENVKTLAQYFEEGGENALTAVKAVCTAITAAATNGNPIPFVGAGGILVDGEKVLFAPEALFSYAANTLPAEETLNQHTGFLNDTIKDLPALCFERAAIIYRLLAGRLPFTATDSIARNADIFDRKFLPIEYCVNGIDSGLALAINNALKLNSTAVNVPGKRKKGKSSEDLRPVADFPLEKIDEAFRLSQNNKEDKDFEEKVSAYIKAQNSKINTKRHIKRNATTLTVIATIIVIVICVTVSTLRTRGEDYTSVGLTSTQTIRAYMNGVNEKDTMLLSDFGDGKAAGDYGDMVSRIYVMHKQRLAYGNDNGFGYPANWLFYITDEAKYKRSGIYGVTNLKIDGKAETLAVELKKKNQNPAPLEKEGNIKLENGSTSVHKVEYYLLYTEGEEVDYIVEKVTSTVTLTFKKNRWIITDIQYDGKNLGVDCDAFKKDYFAALEKTNGEVIPAVDSLRSKYEWLPEKDAMQREKEQIEYYLTHPYASLGL